jgi:vacuolar iron transporter family protein
MKKAIKVGLSFGLTSGIISTLGLMVGLNAGTASEMVVIGGVLTIAIADSASDALGIHMSEESQKGKKNSDVWLSTIVTFGVKFLFALSFAIPILLFDLPRAIVISIIWGLLLIAVFSYYIASSKGEKPWPAVGEHLLITILVIIATNFVGDWISKIFSY